MVDLRDPSLGAPLVVTALALTRHPEGGWYRETWRDLPLSGAARGVGTAILFLLESGEASAWHRVDADELWLWQAGAPLALGVGDERLTLGPEDGQVLQGVVPRFAWQSAATLGAWSLVSCVVCPAFSFEGFELGERNLLSGPAPG